MNVPQRFALNHMMAPRLPLPALLAAAQVLGVNAVEIRTDPACTPIIEGASAETLRAQAEAAGVSILSINLQQSLDGGDAKAALRTSTA